MPHGEMGCEKHFLLQSRLDLMVINEFEKSLGTAMCVAMPFVMGWIVCGLVPFTEFLIAGLLSSMRFPFIVAIFALWIIFITIQMCWFVRAKLCGDAEDKAKVEQHNREAAQVQAVRRAQSAPNVARTNSNNLR